MKQQAPVIGEPPAHPGVDLIEALVDARGEIGKAPVDAVEPLVDTLEPLVDTLEALVDTLEPLVDTLEPLVDSLELLVDGLELLVDPFEPVVDAGKASIHLLLEPCQLHVDRVCFGHGLPVAKT
jgi:hypothetical protein